MSLAPESLDPKIISLFLDVDGTLLDICDNPGSVTADDQLVVTLQRCFVRLGGALSLVSGRSIEEVDRIFAPAIFPVAGAHGSEIRLDGGQTTRVINEPLPDDVLQALQTLADSNEGLLVERKHGGASLHYRQAPGLEAKCRRLVTRMMSDLGDAYRLISGKMVFEIAPAAHDKGAAIHAFQEQAPFAGRAPVFIGDDVTDEDGFRVANDLAGTSIRVGENGQTEAKYRLPDVASVRQWLHTVILADRANPKKGVK